MEAVVTSGTYDRDATRAAVRLSEVVSSLEADEITKRYVSPLTCHIPAPSTSASRSPLAEADAGLLLGRGGHQVADGLEDHLELTVVLPFQGRQFAGEFGFLLQHLA